MTSSSIGPPSTLPTVTETSPRIHPSSAQTGSHDTVPNVEIVVGTLFGVLFLIFGGRGRIFVHQEAPERL